MFNSLYYAIYATFPFFLAVAHNFEKKPPTTDVLKGSFSESFSNIPKTIL